MIPFDTVRPLIMLLRFGERVTAAGRPPCVASAYSDGAGAPPHDLWAPCGSSLSWVKVRNEGLSHALAIRQYLRAAAQQITGSVDIWHCTHAPYLELWTRTSKSNMSAGQKRRALAALCDEIISGICNWCEPCQNRSQARQATGTTSSSVLIGNDETNTSCPRSATHIP